MRGHTGGTMSMGKGTLHNKSSKQKLNTRSTTESELVGVSKYLPYDLWQVNFLWNKVLTLGIILFIRTTRVQLKWKEMEEIHVQVIRVM